MSSALLWEPRRTPRIVIDTPTVVAALMFGGGEPGALRRAWQDGRCLPMVCQATERALETHLSMPSFGFGLPERQDLLDDYLRYAYRVRLEEHDAEADAVQPGLVAVRLALAGRAHALIASNAELMLLAGQLHCPVTPLDQFLEQLDRLTPRRSAAARIAEARAANAQTSAARSASHTGAVSM